MSEAPPVRDEKTAYALKYVKKDTAKAELWRRWMRYQFRNNLWFAVYEVLGYKDLDPSFHLKMCRRLNRWKKRPDGHWYKYELDAWPRGGYKTTIKTVSQSIQTLMRCPEETIIIEHGELDKSIAIVSQIRAHFESNEFLRWLFPDIIWDNVNQAPAWTKERMTLRRAGTYSEASIIASSYGSEATSAHCTLLCFDDLVCEGNITSEGMMDIIHEHFRMSSSTLTDERKIGKNDPRWRPWFEESEFYDPTIEKLMLPFRIRITATRWDWRDSTSRVLDPEGDFAGNVNSCVVPAIDREGKSFFPGKFPLHVLADIKKELGTFSFNAQYMQDPTAPDTLVFVADDIQYWTTRPNDRLPNLPDNVHIYIVVDPNADWESDKGDKGSIAVWAVDALGNYYLLAYYNDRFNPQRTIEILIDEWQAHTCRAVIVETVAYQKTLKFWFQQKTRSMGMVIPIIEVKRGGVKGQSKTNRLIGLQPLFESKRIYLLDGSHAQMMFKKEVSRYRGRPNDVDDGLDTLYDMVDKSIRPRLVAPKAPPSPRVKLGIEVSTGISGKELLTCIGVSEKRPKQRRFKGWR